MDLKEIDILGANINDHWYYKSKANAMIQTLGKIKLVKVLDVGAGSGFFSKYLLDNLSVQEAWCVDTSYKKNKSEKIKNKSIFFQRTIKKNNADLVLFMDVLEHVIDDTALVKDYIKKVNKGTYFLVTVPAFNFLWSEHDEFLGHKRRYSLGEMENLLIRSGLEIEKSFYFFGLVLPIAALSRILQKSKTKKTELKSQLTNHSYITNIFLGSLCKIELFLMKHNRIAGLSIFCLAKKK
jgi:hypothetical protein